MSHIITSNEDIKLISEQLDILRTRGYSKNSLYELLNYIIPQNEEYQVIPRISETGLPGYFSGYERLIHISEQGLKKYIKNDVKVYTEIYPYLKKHEQELFYYLTLFVLTHEVEHAYQYMIGKEYIDFPYQLVIDAYKHITDFSSYYKYPQIITKLLIERYKIKKNNPRFVLERNANLEAFDLLEKIAKYENNFDLLFFIVNQKIKYQACGYQKIKYNGSFEESYKKTCRESIYKKFNHEEEISQEDRIRYALPIENKDRIILLKKFVNTKE